MPPPMYFHVVGSSKGPCIGPCMAISIAIASVFNMFRQQVCVPKGPATSFSSACVACILPRNLSFRLPWKYQGGRTHPLPKNISRNISLRNKFNAWVGDIYFSLTLLCKFYPTSNRQKDLISAPEIKAKLQRTMKKKISVCYFV